PEALADAARSGEGYLFVEHGVEKRRSYADLYDASIHVARKLREQGLGPGDLVALIIAGTESFLTTLFGASLAGLVPASVFPPAPTADPKHYLALTAETVRFARARAVVTDVKSLDALCDWGSSCPQLSSVIAYETLRPLSNQRRSPQGSATTTQVEPATSADD